MVCEKCEKKLSKVIVPDKWKEGASNTTEGGGRKINENKLLSKKQSNMLETAQGIAHEIVLNIAQGKSGAMNMLEMNVSIVHNGHHMETLNALSVNNKFTKMPNTATLVLIPKVPLSVRERKRERADIRCWFRTDVFIFLNGSFERDIGAVQSEFSAGKYSSSVL
ncbi:hypothetical protein HPP92_000718 [Vanilla planifolia]|uniref:Cysteine-rich PDZ-binding protein n=1 Tax=Vanilla planifolia TaxID=51239 RepID=A0A835RYK6_VANPL|nr:hypothetical protein HPP92_000718 [Vanilla planifolia]